MPGSSSTTRMRLLTGPPWGPRRRARRRTPRGERSRRLLLGCRQPHADRRPTPRPRVELDAAAEGTHRLAHDREPQAEPIAVATAGTVEALEDGVALFASDPRSRVPHLDRHAVAG